MSGEASNHHPAPRVIIAGYGLPGRHIAELLDDRHIPFVVIEQNPVTAERCTTVRVITGDARDESILRLAGIMEADALALTLPNEEVVQESVAVARRLRPDIRILARCNYTSAGFKAQQLGADVVIVEEQLVAQSFHEYFDDLIALGKIALPARP